MYYTTLLGQFCAINENWEEILSKDPYNLKISRDEEFVIFKYNQLSSDFTNEIVREARGIIFREGKWTVPVCRGFDKFFNYGEPNASNINWNSAKVTQKIDGSLIKVWYDIQEDKWRISTNGTIDAFKAETGDFRVKTFGDLFLSAIKGSFDDLTQYFVPFNTYLFELVSPINRVVIPYEKVELYYLGFRDNEDTYFINPFYNTRNFSVLENLGIKQPKVYDLSNIENCIKAANELPWDEEGYVVDDKNYNRIKIKSPAYVIAHHARNNGVITPKTLINVLLENEVDEFLTYADDCAEDIKKIKNHMDRIREMGNALQISIGVLIYAKSQNINVFANKKDYALYINQLIKDNNWMSIYSDYLFKLWNNPVLKFDNYVSEKWTVEKWLKAINTYSEENNV